MRSCWCHRYLSCYLHMILTDQPFITFRFNRYADCAVMHVSTTHVCASRKVVKMPMLLVETSAVTHKTVDARSRSSLSSRLLSTPHAHDKTTSISPARHITDDHPRCLIASSSQLAKASAARSAHARSMGHQPNCNPSLHNFDPATKVASGQNLG